MDACFPPQLLTASSPPFSFAALCIAPVLFSQLSSIGLGVLLCTHRDSEEAPTSLSSLSSSASSSSSSSSDINKNITASSTVTMIAAIERTFLDNDTGLDEGGSNDRGKPKNNKNEMKAQDEQNHHEERCLLLAIFDEWQ